jgi:ferredoxin
MLSALNLNCSGCRICLLACAVENQKEMNPKKAALAVKGHFPSPGGYELKLCDQCGACAEACPAEAISEQNGVFLIDPDECTGCGICADECPNGVIFMHPDSLVPIKCTDCGACARLCPRGAITHEREAAS